LRRTLLRAERRCEDPERGGRAGKDNQTLHDAFPRSAGAGALGGPGPRIDTAGPLSSL
jgi:hypothetical protein